MADTTQTIHLYFEEPSLSTAPERIPVLPTPGNYPHPVYGTLDFEADTITEFVSNFANGIYGQTLPIDIEHDHLSGAAGYIKELHTNDNGSVDATVEWTPMGKQLLAEDRFRYVSPSMLTTWTSPATRATHKNVLTGAALTKRPYFKSDVLRPLITASEPVDTTAIAEGKETMSEKTETQATAEAEGSKIVEQKFGERLALAEQTAKDFERKFAESETQRTELATEVANLKAAAQERTFREQLAGATDIDDRVKELAALPVELHEGYIARAKADASARKQFAERGPIGSDALGDGSGTDAVAKVNQMAAELVKADPTLTFAEASTRVIKANPQLYRQYDDERKNA